MSIRFNLLLISLLALQAMESVAAQSPNIILFLADDQGWTGTSVRMDKNDPRSRSDFYQTPKLDKGLNNRTFFGRQAQGAAQRRPN